jgi:DNA-binding CsgD family transcriptional regulator
VNHRVGRLTKREREVADLVSKGHSTKEIGYLLQISSNTVYDHIRSIYGKLEISSRSELAVIIALDNVTGSES